jgi:four helix bundle protein
MEYKDLDVWKKSRFLAKSIIEVAELLPSKENFAMGFQIRKSAISIPSNIAEGCGRNTTKDTLQFLYIARGSLYEVETQLILCFDFNYITEEKLNELIEQITECKKLLNGFINYYISKLNIKN